MDDNIESRIQYDEKVYIEIEIGDDALCGEAQLCHRIDYYDRPEGVEYFYLEINKPRYELIRQLLKENEAKSLPSAG